MPTASKPLGARRATRNRLFFRALRKNHHQHLDIEQWDNFLVFKLSSFTLLCYSSPSKRIYVECWTKDCLAFVLQAKESTKMPREETSSDQFIWLLNVNFVLPRWHSGKESACRCRRSRFDPWVRQIPWSRKWQPTLVFLPGKFQEQRTLVGYSPWGCKESDTTGWVTAQAHVNLTKCGV